MRHNIKMTDFSMTPAIVVEDPRRDKKKAEENSLQPFL